MSKDNVTPIRRKGVYNGDGDNTTIDQLEDDPPDRNIDFVFERGRETGFKAGYYQGYQDAMAETRRSIDESLTRNRERMDNWET